MGAGKKYLAGLGNYFQSEALPGALPVGQNSPQRCAYGLYAEQLSGTAFTAPRSENQRSWLYRIRPSVLHGSFTKLKLPAFQSAPFENSAPTPEQLRWDPLQIPKGKIDFLSGVFTVAANGSVSARWGGAVHLFAANKSMGNDFFCNADAEMLFVPENGGIILWTEFGELSVDPLEIAVVPRGVKFQVRVKAGETRGYVIENYGHAFRLPHLGVIGSNSCADPKDFLSPVARYEDCPGKFRLVMKFQGGFWQAPLGHSPLDVVAWQGTYAPYKYDLNRFQPVGSLRVDHPDPSIWTVLTSPSEHAGVANMDFVIFPPRWSVAEKTFRPPWYHRNCMSEYMGLIKGVYDAKKAGFVPGGGSLHNCMSAHGPDAETFEKASKSELEPTFIGDTMAFMFESFYAWHPTDQAMKSKYLPLQSDYLDCWKNLKSQFNPKENLKE